jgi:guanylate kinase
MDIKNERLILLGKTGSGKTYLERKLVEKGLKPCLKWTTRPKRKFEEQGITYNFVNDSEFIQSISEDKFLVYQTFIVTPKDSNPKTWYYGITNEEFNNSQIFIMTPFEINQLTSDDLKKCFVVYLDIDIDIIRKRISKRNDNNDSIERRLESDKIDFKDFDKYDLKITDPDFDADSIYDLMN